MSKVIHPELGFQFGFVCPFKILILSPVTPIFSHPHKRFFSTYLHVTGLQGPGLKTDIQSPKELLYLPFGGVVDMKQTRDEMKA